MSGFDSSDDESDDNSLQNMEPSSSMSIIDGSYETTFDGIKMVFKLEQDLIFEFLEEEDLFSLGDADPFFMDMTTKFLLLGPRDLYVFRDE